MSMREFERELEAADDVRREQYERTIAAAWYTVAIENGMRGSGRLKSLNQTIEEYAPRLRPEQVNKPSPSDIAGQLSWLGIAKKPMSEETRAAMWKPKVPVSANG